ncbi:MAG: DUF3857 domain-containing protein [Planctomycetes bacterium]|nr:DUF3857 domain-containing protein [Planctomycetota bacterium]
MPRRLGQRAAVYGCLALLLWMVQFRPEAAEVKAPPVDTGGVHALGGKPASAEAERGFKVLLEGKESEAFPIFEAASKKGGDATATFGLALHQRLRGYPQEALESLTKALLDGRQEPWAEVYLDLAEDLLPECREPKPFLEAAAALEGDANLRPYLRDRVRHVRAEWLQDGGRYAEAAQAYAPLQYLTSWALIGPFDNRDKAGFETEYEPENEVQFEKPVPGRNRPVAWFSPKAVPMNGVVNLAQVFEPNTHSLAYGVTFVKVDQAQWAVMRVGCAGAIKVWLNEREVLQLNEYNDYAPEKGAAPVYLQKGVNQLLVKSAVVEDTGWSFSVRFSKPEGGPVPGLLADAGAETLKAYKSANVGRGTPLLEPQDPDLGVVVKMRDALKGKPNDALLRAFYGYEMDARKLGNREDNITVKEYVKAVDLCPQCPLFRFMLSFGTTDLNQARQAAEAALKSHPDLPRAYERLTQLASLSNLELTAEEYARQAFAKFGAERSGECPLYLASALQQRGEAAEAYRLIKAYTGRNPYNAQGWETLLGLETTNRDRRETLKQALTYCGGDQSLRSQFASDLSNQEKDRESAEYLESSLAVDPFAIGQWVSVSRAWRRAGDEAKARALLEQARAEAPENPGLLLTLGLEAFRANDLKAAEEFWRGALNVKPNFPEIKDLLTEISKGKGIDRDFFAAYDVDVKSLPVPKPEDYPKDHSVTMLKQEVVRVNPNGTTSRMVHLVAKLLRQEGVAALQNHQINYEPQRQIVDILKASVITPEGRELARANINDRTTSAAMGVQTLIYDEYHLKEIFFRDLEPGSIVDLQYIVRDNGENIYGDYFADLNYLGDDQPVQRAQYILDLPKSREFQKKAFRINLNPERLDSKDPAREVWKWEARDQAGIIQERSMPPMLDMLPFVQTTSMKTWQEVSTWYWNLAKDSIVVDDDMKKIVAQITADAQTPTEKLRAVHDWVIKKIRYLGIEFGRNGFKPHRSTESFKALYGDCKDTATLITAMLKAANIESHLVLIRTIDHGKVDEDTLPAPNLFNHCIAYVPDVEGKDYWIDCTTDFHQLGEVPYLDQGAQVLVVGPEGGKFVQIPKGKAQETVIEQKINATVDKNGAGTLFVRSVYTGQYAPSYRQFAETPGQLKRYLNEEGSKRFPGAELVRMNNAAPAEQGPMWVEAEYKVPSLAGQSGDRKAASTAIEPLNLSTRYITGNDRTHDLELWFPWSKTCELSYRLDDSLKVAALPGEANLKEDFATFTRRVSNENGVVRIVDEFVLLSQRIPKDQYVKFNAFCRKVDSYQSQKLMLEAK